MKNLIIGFILLFSFCFPSLEMIQGADGDSTKTSKATLKELTTKVSRGGILPGSRIDKNTDGIKYVGTRLLPRITNWIVVAVFSLATGVIIIGGFMYIFTSHNSDLQGKGRDTIVWGIIGLFVVSFAYVVIRLLVNFNF